jgi:hypothetical protein
MRKQSTMIRLAGIVLAVVFLCSCATVPKTPLGQYSAALEVFNDAVDGYATHYSMASPGTQAKWKEDIDPIILKTANALGVWGLAVKRHESAADKYAQYMTLKRELFLLMFSTGVLEVK